LASQIRWYPFFSLGVNRRLQTSAFISNLGLIEQLGAFISKLGLEQFQQILIKFLFFLARPFQNYFELNIGCRFDVELGNKII
jgi:hypothetical protein